MEGGSVPGVSRGNRWARSAGGGEGDNDALADANEDAPAATAGGQGRGRGKRRSVGGGEGSAPAGATAKSAPAPPPASLEEARKLSSDLQGLRFMQTAKQEEQKKLYEKEQLAHIQDLQWVIPGFETENLAAESTQGKRASEPSGAPPPVRLHRRSYKGYNNYVELMMKDTLKKHADATARAEELEQAYALRGMKQRRTGRP
eukprot:TRINITY_DN22962_c0_g3_i1.p2 TRINITY_DN22962_c0_g3~~TRINITY_DN22962_c0_g3_i1.p2  ORF type:complete len:202 (-),score=47.37 TRINITY_DN22962_c0_g3_i1:161-766(-)